MRPHTPFEAVKRQPFVGCATSAVALTCVAASVPAHLTMNALAVGTAAVLVAALILSYRFPVHILRSTKVYMGSVALYLIATLVPPTFAAIAAGIGVFGGTWLTRSERDLYLSDIATDAGRWVVVVLAGSLVEHAIPGTGAVRALPLAPTAAVLWIGDMLTAPLVFGPIIGDRPWHIVRALAHEGGITEGYQYLLGLLGVLAEMQMPGALLLLAAPIVPLHVACKRMKETQDSTRRVLEAMADAVDLRDPYTGGHSQRVAHYTSQILAAMKLHGPEVDLIVAAARVHDIGKIGAPDSVLLKDGKLTPEEQAIMEQHPVKGAELLARYRDFARGTAIVRSHHERWDGKGYPDRLKGTDIPFGARIVAVADSYDAMTSDRPYRAGMPVAKAAGILREGSGTQWDAEVVATFLGVLGYGAAAATPSPAPLLPTIVPHPVAGTTGA